MAQPARNVFVSYTSSDAAGDFVAGENFDVIFHAIDSADAFVPVLSRRVQIFVTSRIITGTVDQELLLRNEYLGACGAYRLIT